MEYIQLRSIKYRIEDLRSDLFYPDILFLAIHVDVSWKRVFFEILQTIFEPHASFHDLLQLLPWKYFQRVQTMASSFPFLSASWKQKKHWIDTFVSTFVDEDENYLVPSYQDVQNLCRFFENAPLPHVLEITVHPFSVLHSPLKKKSSVSILLSSGVRIRPSVTRIIGVLFHCNAPIALEQILRIDPDMFCVQHAPGIYFVGCPDSSDTLQHRIWSCFVAVFTQKLESLDIELHVSTVHEHWMQIHIQLYRRVVSGTFYSFCTSNARRFGSGKDRIAFDTQYDALCFALCDPTLRILPWSVPLTTLYLTRIPASFDLQTCIA